MLPVGWSAAASAVVDPVSPQHFQLAGTIPAVPVSMLKVLGAPGTWEWVILKLVFRRRESKPEDLHCNCFVDLETDLEEEVVQSLLCQVV